MANDRDKKFVDSLKIGDIIHYAMHMGSFVRCEVIDVKGRKLAKALALCGAWPWYDLPHRNKTGDPVLGAAGMILNKEEMIVPYASVVFEAPGYAYREKDEVNPATMKEIDLTIPAMTKAQKRDAIFYRAIVRIRAIFDADPSDPHALTPRAQLEKAVIEAQAVLL